ncbi:PLP-dependent aminotransferase family protein [Paenibacillus thailandensis]|uniref:PLP-dependent aminotransferase family protein n=1 Tax=Paenibacillus thailandensis TaxID=393250 RepID=A0ABW5QV67_9BACL
MNKYEAITSKLKEAVRTGAIKPGDKLPSLRETAEAYGCSINTAIRAYGELEKERLIYAVPKSGYFAVSRPVPKENGPTVIADFASAVPDPEVMPTDAFRQCLNRAIELYQDLLFAYSDPQGFPSLRRSLVRHLAAAQVFADINHISVVSGAQQALHILAGMPFPNGGEAVLIEQPAFAGMVRTLQLLRVPAVGICRTEAGFDIQELEARFQSGRIKFFYTVPRFHNPTGFSLPRRQKEEIVRLAERYGVYIVEDDYLADLECDRKNDPLYSLDGSGHVVYVKSFSKVMLPGLRLAAAVVPDKLLETFRRFKSSADSSTAALSQAALELYLESGLFDRHAASMRERYTGRMEALRIAARDLSDGFCRMDVPAGGLFATLYLPEHVDPVTLAGLLRDRGVTVMPTDGCYLPGSAYPKGLRIGIIRTNEAQIAAGLRIVREEIERLQQKRLRLLRSSIHWI